MGVDDTFDPYSGIFSTQPDDWFQHETHRPTGMGTTIPVAYGQYALVGNTLVDPSADLSAWFEPNGYRGFSPPQHLQSNLGSEYVLHQPVETPGLSAAAERGFGTPFMNAYNMWANGGIPLEYEDPGSPLRCEMHPGGLNHLTTDISPESSQVSPPREFPVVQPTRRAGIDMVSPRINFQVNTHVKST